MSKITCKYVRKGANIYTPVEVTKVEKLDDGTEATRTVIENKILKAHSSISRAKHWSRIEQLANGGLGMGLVRVDRG